MSLDELPTTIDPDECPGGVVFVHYVDGVERLVQKLGVEAFENGMIPLSADYGAEQVAAWRSEGAVEISMQVFDGDDGRRVLTVPVGRPQSEWIWHYRVDR